MQPKVAKPDWLEVALPGIIRSLELVQNKTVPEQLHGWFIKTAAMQLLRCVYGSDLDTIANIRENVFNGIQVEQEFEQKMNAFLATGLSEEEALEKIEHEELNKDEENQI